MAYASGKFAIAICDRCGFQYAYKSLKKEWTGFRVCKECYEPKEPQLDPVPHVADPEAIRNPRPQVSSSLVAGEGVVRTIDANSMMTTTGDSIGFAFSMDASTGEIGTVTVVIT
jgi:hypothetical protein